MTGRERPLRAHCPLRRAPGRSDRADVLEQSGDLLAALRRLHRDRRLCQRCAESGRCFELDNFNLLVQQAIQEVIDEWDRSSD